MAGSFHGAPIRSPSFSEILDDLSLAGTDNTASRWPHAPAAGRREWLFSFTGQTATRQTASRPIDWDVEETEPDAEIAVELDLDEDKIAAELGLVTARSLAELKQARRSFARGNHPDLFAPALRAKANARMQLANMLLDRARKDIESGR